MKKIVTLLAFILYANATTIDLAKLRVEQTKTVINLYKTQIMINRGLIKQEQSQEQAEQKKSNTNRLKASYSSMGRGVFSNSDNSKKSYKIDISSMRNSTNSKLKGSYNYIKLHPNSSYSQQNLTNSNNTQNPNTSSSGNISSSADSSNNSGSNSSGSNSSDSNSSSPSDNSTKY